MYMQSIPSYIVVCGGCGELELVAAETGPDMKCEECGELDWQDPRSTGKTKAIAAVSFDVQVAIGMAVQDLPDPSSVQQWNALLMELAVAAHFDKWEDEWLYKCQLEAARLLNDKAELAGAWRN